MKPISFIHSIETEQNIRVKFGKSVTRNTEFAFAMVTLELRSAKQLY